MTGDPHDSGQEGCDPSALLSPLETWSTPSRSMSMRSHNTDSRLLDERGVDANEASADDRRRIRQLFPSISTSTKRQVMNDLVYGETLLKHYADCGNPVWVDHYGQPDRPVWCDVCGRWERLRV